jgi:hypothetical protein
VRRCLLEPIPELELAVSSLDTAVDCLLQNDKERASQLILEADIPAIRDYAIRIVGKLSTDVHRRTALSATTSKDNRVKERMPAQSLQDKIFARDGWRCRFCGVRAVSRRARKLICGLFPSETRWTMPEFQRHSALYATAASIDHVVPHSRGGRDDPANLVTACYCCQFGRGNFTLAEVELSDPRERPPQVTGWDGLERLLTLRTGAT